MEEKIKYNLLWVSEEMVPKVKEVKIYKDQRTIRIVMKSGSSVKLSKGAGMSNWLEYLDQAVALHKEITEIEENEE